MHKEGRGTINISFAQKDENTLLATVTDNGIGRKAAAELKRKTVGHKSKGLSITASRLDLLNQSSDNSVNVSTIDLKDENSNAMGTRVEVLLPVG